MKGATAVATTMRINGTDQTVTVASDVNAGGKSIEYAISVPGMAGVSIQARLAVDKNVLAFNITEITETGTARVNLTQI